MKKILILGGGGFIGGHLAKRLFNEGNFVRVVDIKRHEYFKTNEFCSEFIQGDLRDQQLVEKVMFSPNQISIDDKENSFDEVYQLAADMGGAGYIFTGDNDANVMHNSALINLNVSYYASKFKVKKLFYSSSACMYPEHNQLDPNNPNCEESSAYPANPDSEYGWEKLFSERLYLAFNRNYGLNVRVARFHNIFGPYGTWKGGKEKAPAAMCRKVAETPDGGEIEVWGDGLQTRSFLYIDECIEAVLRLMESDFKGPVNIGSEEMVTINQLAQMAIDISGKNIKINNIKDDEFKQKYGFKCPVGVKGRNSDNKLYKEKIGWSVSEPLIYGLERTYQWINRKSRGAWGTPANLNVLKSIINKPKFIILYRPVLECLASFIKIENPKNIEERCHELMNEDGMIGKNLWSIKNILKNNENYIIINYLDLINSPKKEIEKIYTFLNVKFFDHVFKNINQFSVNGVKYNDSVLLAPLHTIRTDKIKLNKYNIKDYLPTNIIKQYSNLDI